MTLKVFEAFSGVGSQAMALRELGIDYEVVAISEIDKFSIQSYKVIHGEVTNLGDISKITVDEIPDHDLFTYSFPCQDISVAGRQKGLDEDSESRSSLLWQCKKVIQGKKPKYLLLENVKNLIGKKHKANFEKWLAWLTDQGYTNYWQVLNAKHYGVPQNRERVFVVSILGDHVPFEFPPPIELTKRLKDVLENEVEDKYYLDNDKTRALISQLNKKEFKNRSVVDASVCKPKVKKTANCITARENRGISNRASEGNAVIEQVGNLEKVLGDYDGKFNDPQIGRVFDPKVIEKLGNINPSGNGMNGDVFSETGLSPTLTTNKGEGPKILQKARGFNKGGEHEISPSLTTSSWQENNFVSLPVIAASRGRNPEKPSDRTPGNYVEQRLEINKNGTSNALTTVQKDNYVIEESGLYTGDSPEFHRGALSGLSRTLKANKHDAGVTDGYRIRKLTPLECWRLMGFSDEDFYKAEAVCSNSQLYKQAGNSIVVTVLEAIFRNMFMKGEV